MTATRLAFLKPRLLALGLAVGVAGAVAIAQTQTPGAPAAPVPAAQPAQPAKPSVSTRAPIHSAAVRTAPPARAEVHPTWAELTPPQQQALAPLASTWRSLGEAHKRKWLALSENFSTMSPPEQAVLHSRMTEWAALSVQQRNAARLNYAETRKVAPSEKRAKWEAYQALPPEEKRRLAGKAAAKPTPPGTALAVKPVPQQQLAKVPKSKKAEGGAKIAVIPGQVDNNTLLPQPLAPLHP